MTVYDTAEEPGRQRQEPLGFTAAPPGGSDDNLQTGHPDKQQPNAGQGQEERTELDTGHRRATSVGHLHLKECDTPLRTV